MRLPAILHHLLLAAALASLSALVTRAMIGARLMDVPDAGRKAHAAPIPKGGGVGVVAAYLTGVLTLYAVADFARLAEPYFLAVIAASCLIAVVAFADDLLDWPFAVKLVAQVVAALVAVGSGFAVEELRVPVLGAVPLGWAGPVLTVAWIVFATNAVNFIDGMDGLAGGTALIAAAALAAMAATQEAWFAYFAALLLAAGLAGFLPFNFPRARIFMGDVGSQFCGFTLALLGVAAARFGTIEMSALIVPMLLAPVLWDVAFTLARRGLAGERLTQAHRGHLYQLAQRAGMGAGAITLIYWAMTGWGVLCCALFLGASPWAKAALPFVTLLPAFIWTAMVLRRARTRGVLA